MKAMTAIVIGPKTIMPSEWTRPVWDMEDGNESPECETADEAQEILKLLMRWTTPKPRLRVSGRRKGAARR